MKRAGYSISCEALEKLLGLPPGINITHGEWDNDHAVLKLYYTGDNLACSERDERGTIQFLDCLFRRDINP